MEVASKFIPINNCSLGTFIQFSLESLSLSILHVVIEEFCGDMCVNL